MQNDIIGYKCFNEGLINRYGYQFSEGMTYHANNEIHYRKNGFHMCVNLEDTLRYFDAFNENVDIALVRGFGNRCGYIDEYNDFYNIYAVENITILHVLTHEEIINYALNLDSVRLKRFISLYKLNPMEIDYFKNRFCNDERIILAIEYYQENKKDVYRKRL